MSFCIITDSASDVPASVRNKYNLKVLPTPVTIDGTDYFDADTIFPDEFYKIQAEGTHEIKTYHISQYMFEEAFRPYAERGDELLYLCFSTGIAGTFQAASLALAEIKEEYPDFKMTIIDTKCASAGYGVVAERLLTMQKNGAPTDLIIEAAQFFCDHMEHAIAVETLDYLYKGGRISKASFVVGGVLDIKPIITIDENGSLKATEKIRGWKRALSRILDMVGEKGADLKNQLVGVCYGTNLEDAEFLEAELKSRYHIKSFLRTQVGCAIGAHTGPGVAAVTFLNATDPRFDKYLK